MSSNKDNKYSEPENVIVDDFIDEDRTLTQDIKYKITTYGADFLVDGIVSRFVSGDIYVPDFQRSYVWTRPQASRYIESILLGLPTPGIFLYKESETNKFLIVDGLQRLSTLKSFVPSEGDKDHNSFPLEKVNKIYAGKAYGQLSAEDQRQIKNTVIHATIFQQIDPPNDDDEKNSIYLVFERLNTGGTPLQPQEIRSALYHGPFIDFLTELNKVKSWRTVFGRPNPRRKDEELILRFLAFLYNKSDYTSPMVRFLNKYAAKNRKMTNIDKQKVIKKFEETFTFISNSLGSTAFRPQRNLNAAIF